ncbi:MAG: nuclear transport factor 2 family protein [Alphaproteobacteria bacterium]
MVALTRKQMINMVEHSYFSNVDHKNLNVVLDCFADDAVFTVQSAFTSYEGRDTGIKKFYETITAGFQEIWHGDFEHTVDVDSQRMSTQFNVRRKDLNGDESSMSNCNVFRFENGKFKQVFVYASGGNPLVPND